MNLKIKTILSIFTILLLSIGELLAQEKHFSSEPEAFMSQLKSLFKETQREELDQLYTKLEKYYKEGVISDKQQERMVDVLNIMHFRKMQVYPYYRDFIEASTLAYQSQYDEAFLDRWYNYVKGVLKNAKIGQNKDFNIFIDFSNDLFSKNCLSADKSKKWMITSKDINFSYIEGKTYVKVMNTDIKGFFDTDTVRILNTSGVYSVNDKLWKGTKGTITWDRVGMTPIVNFGEYTIDMKRSEYSIDSATMTFKEYFPEPLYGRVIDRITKKSDTEDIDYPQFYSYGKNYSYRNLIAPNVSCSGGFILKGRKVIVGTNEGNPVNVTIENGQGKRVFSSVGTQAIFEKGKYIYMGGSRVKLYANKDSIVHPFSQFRYDVGKRTLTVNQEEYGSGKARYRSSYHQMSFETEMMTWKIDSNEIILQNLTGKGKNATKFVSDHNFDQSTYNLARTAAADNDPLTILSKMSEATPEGIPLDDFTRKLGPAFSNSSVLSTVFMLEKEGFLEYKPNDKKIKVNKEFADFYVKAYSKKIDYDLIRFNGYGVDQVGIYNIQTNKLTANNVAKIPFNDSARVYAFPRDSTPVEISNKRKLKFDGRIMAGRMDLYGTGFDFEYDSFSIKSKLIEQMKIYVPKHIDPATGYDKGVKPLRSQIDSFKGLLTINGKFNKSGKASARQYPKLTTYTPGYIYYDHPNIFDGIYTRDSFKFEVAPFTKDSMQYFNPESLAFEGKLHSSHIFNEFAEKARIMPDFSLGFVTQTPAGGFKTYRNLGIFEGQVSLSNNGLVGKGIQKHQSLALTADSILYFPRRAYFEAKKSVMSMRKTPTELPEFESENSLVDWKPYSDTMLIASRKGKPFSMYEGATDMNGLLILTSKGLFGNGYLDFPEAKISSNQMVFKSMVMTADTSSMEIKSIGNKVTFKTPNVSTKMDFVRKIGEFKSNEKDISTVFAENKYKAEINEFTWDMNKKILTFTSPPGSLGSKFTSIHPEQDSLFFFAQKAEYNMTTSVIKVTGANEILIADSRVQPQEGKLTIYPNAKIETLVNASIEGDTTNGWHIFDECKLDIHGKNDIVGYGNYTLNVNDEEHKIKLNSIRSIKKEVGKTKKKLPIYAHTIEGKGKVEQAQKIKLYRNVEFFGDVSIFMNQKFPHFKGSQRIRFTNPSYSTPWFSVDNTIDVERFQFVNKNLVSSEGNALITAFMVDRNENGPNGLYTSILNKPTNNADQIAFDARGVVSHDPETNRYIFGDSARILASSATGNQMVYSEDSGNIKAQGQFNPNLKLGGIPVIFGGEIDNQIESKNFDFRVGITMQLQLDKRVLATIGNVILQEFSDNKDINYTKKLTKYQLREVLHPTDYTKLEQDIENTGLMTTPLKATPSNLILTNIELKWDPEDLCYRNTSQIGLAMLAGVPINKEVTGYIEFGYGEYQDYFNLYLKAKNREWIYFNFSDGVLGIVSSNDNINGLIEATDPKRRYVRKSDKEYYKFALANTYEAEQFQKRMKAGGKFSSEEKTKYFGTDKPDYGEKELKDAEPFEDKTPTLKEIEEQNAKQDQLLKEAEEKLAKEQEEAEQAAAEKKKKLKKQMEEDLEKASQSDIKETGLEEDTPTQPETDESEATEDKPNETPTETPDIEGDGSETEETREKELEESKRDADPENAPKKKVIPKELFDKYF